MPRSSSRATVLVVGSELRAGPRAIRSLTRAGYRVLGAHIHDPFGGRSLACPRPLRHPAIAGDGADFAEWLRTTVRAHRVDAVIGVHEDAARAIAHIPDALGTATRVGPDAAQYAALCDKWRLAAVSARADVDHPATVLVTAEHGVPGELPLPAIVKPRLSGEAIEEQAVKAELVQSREALDEVAAALHEVGADAIAQEVVTGRRWSIQGVATRERGLVAVATEVIADYPRGLGNTSLGAAHPAPEPMRAAVERLCESVGYRGPVNVDVIERDGAFLVHDVNLRLPASLGMTIAAGLDMPRLAVDDALGRPVGHLIPERFGESRYVCVDLELAALLDAVRRRGEPGTAAERPGAVVREVLRHVRAGGRVVLDPNPLDPFWLPVIPLRAARRVAARLLRPASARRDPDVGYPALRGPQGPGPT